MLDSCRFVVHQGARLIFGCYEASIYYIPGTETDTTLPDITLPT